MATMKDVAKKAGVSTYTVSNVLNNLSYLKEETRQKVLDAIDELDYKPNYAGKLLRTQSTRNIGVSLPVLTGSLTGNDFFSQVLLAIYAELNKNNYNMLVSFSNNKEEVDKDNFSKYSEQMISGMISTFTLSDLDFLSNIRYPIVAVDHKPEEFECDSVVTNNEEITKEAVNLLIAKGHKRIGYVGGNYNNLKQSNHFARMQGYVSAMNESDLPVADDYIYAVNLELDEDVLEGYRAAEKLCNAGVSAVIFDNTYSSIGFYQYANIEGFRIPEDVAVIAYDDYDWQTISNPPMTVIKQPTELIGKKAVELLLARIADPEKEIESVVLPCKIIERSSS